VISTLAARNVQPELSLNLWGCQITSPHIHQQSISIHPHHLDVLEVVGKKFPKWSLMVFCHGRIRKNHQQQQKKHWKWNPQQPYIRKSSAMTETLWVTNVHYKDKRSETCRWPLEEVVVTRDDNSSYPLPPTKMESQTLSFLSCYSYYCW